MGKKFKKTQHNECQKKIDVTKPQSDSVTIFFSKKLLFLDARCVGILKNGRKKRCHSSDVTKKKNKLFYIEMKNPRFPKFGKGGSRAHEGLFQKKW